MVLSLPILPTPLACGLETVVYCPPLLARLTLPLALPALISISLAMILPIRRLVILFAFTLNVPSVTTDASVALAPYWKLCVTLLQLSKCACIVSVLVVFIPLAISAWPCMSFRLTFMLPFVKIPLLALNEFKCSALIPID